MQEMHRTRREFVQDAFMGAGMLVDGKARTGKCDKAVQDDPPNVAYRAVHGWPLLPEGFVLGQVSGVGIDSNNQVIIFHRADHSWNRTKERIRVPTIMSFDADTGRLTSSWGADMFVLPHGLRVDHEDNVWVTDIVLQQVLKFTRDGKLLMSIGVKGVPGSDNRHFNQPTDIAIGVDGSFYVTDGYSNSRIARFSPNGDFLFAWGKKGDQPGEFDVPHSITLDRSGRVYVADRSNSRIQIFKDDGSFLQLWKNSDLGRPWGLDIGTDGYLYVVDGGDLRPSPPDRGHAMKLDLNGQILAKWSRFGNYDGQLYWGHDIAVAKNGDVFIGDVYHGMRIQKFTKSTKDCLCLER